MSGDLKLGARHVVKRVDNQMPQKLSLKIPGGQVSSKSQPNNSLSDILSPSPTVQSFADAEIRSARRQTLNQSLTSSKNYSYTDSTNNETASRRFSNRVLNKPTDKSGDSITTNSTTTTTTTTAPPVTPYFLSTLKTTPKAGQSLVGRRCCFCEEPLEYGLLGERLVKVECECVAHYECLAQMIDVRAVRPGEPEAGLPRCPTCDATARPVDAAVMCDLVSDSVMLSSTERARAPRSMPPPPSVPTVPATAPIIGPSDDPAIPPRRPVTPPETVTTPPRTPEQRRHSLTSTVTDTPSTQAGDRAALQTPPSKHDEDRPKARVTLPLKPIAPLRFSFRSRSQLEEVPEEETENGSGPGSAPQPPVVIRPAVESAQTRHAGPTVQVATELETLAQRPGEQYLNCMVTVSVDKTALEARYSPTVVDEDNTQQLRMRLARPLKEQLKLDVGRLGALRLYGTFQVSRDDATWQRVTCFLFERMLILCRNAHSPHRLRIKGSVDLGRHLAAAEMVKTGWERQPTRAISESACLRLNLSAPNLDKLLIASHDAETLRAWHCALADPKLRFPVPYNGDLVLTAPVVPPAVARPVVDTVLLLPAGGYAGASAKYDAFVAATNRILSQMGPLSRLAVLLYGDMAGTTRPASLFRTSGWTGWTEAIAKIKPLGCGAAHNDLAEALANARDILDARTVCNSVATVYLVSDSAPSPLDVASYTGVLETLLAEGAAVHAFGVGINHSADITARTASMTSGSYCYVREWGDLPGCIGSRAARDHARTFRDVFVSLHAADGTRVARVTGTSGSASPDSFAEFDGRPPSAAASPLLMSGRQFPSSATSPVVSLGGLAAGQTVSFLVQVAVSNKAKTTATTTTNKVALFSTSTSYRTFARPDQLASSPARCFIPIETQQPQTPHNLAPTLPATPTCLRLSAFSLSSSYYPSLPSPVGSLQSPSYYYPPPTPAPSTPTAPSPLFSDVLLANEEFPLFLATERHNLTVVRRKLQLVAVEALELVLHQTACGRRQQAQQTLAEVRLFLRGTLEAATADRSTRLFTDVQHTLEVLDSDLAAVAAKVLQPTAFDSDVRSYVIQTVGILRSQFSLSTRSPLEQHFYAS